MQKLEEILQAEDSARRVVAEAHEQAAKLIQEAAAQAELTIISAKHAATDQARARRDEMLAAAGADAESVGTAAEEELAALSAKAEKNMDHAVNVLVRELAG